MFSRFKRSDIDLNKKMFNVSGNQEVCRKRIKVGGISKGKCFCIHPGSVL